MSGHSHEQRVPRPVLLGAAALLTVTVGIAAGARSLRGPEDATPPVASADLRFEDRGDGSLAVLPAADEQPILTVAQGDDGFVRGVLRGLARTRQLEGVDAKAAFRLSRWADGRLALLDPETGHEVDLGSFGRTNYQTFQRMLDAAGGTP